MWPVSVWFSLEFVSKVVIGESLKFMNDVVVKEGTSQFLKILSVAIDWRVFSWINSNFKIDPECASVFSFRTVSLDEFPQCLIVPSSSPV